RSRGIQPATAPAAPLCPRCADPPGGHCAPRRWPCARRPRQRTAGANPPPTSTHRSQPSAGRTPLATGDAPRRAPPAGLTACTPTPIPLLPPDPELDPGCYRIMARRITTGASSSRGPGSLAVRAIHAVTRIVDHTGSRVPRKAANRRRSAGGPGPFHTVLRDLDDPTLILGAYDGGS